MLPEGDRDGHDGSGGQPVPRERAAEALLHEPSYRLPSDWTVLQLPDAAGMRIFC